MNRLAASVAALLFLAPLAAAAASEQSVKIAFVNPHRPQVLEADARALLADLNATRAQRGLAPLAEDPKLSEFALEVARQMALRHYFGHTDPQGVTFRDRLQSAGLADRYAAENMAFDEDERHANAAFLHSPGHYANIVDRHPHRVGTAVVAAGDGEVFFVEEFSD